MSEVDARPAPSRGRTATRGGRGGFGRGGPRGGHRPTNGTKDLAEPTIEDQGELGDMKKQYASQLSMLKDMFPDWTDVDLVFALQETDGDLSTTIDRITEGHVSQFSDVTKKSKDRARSKAKESPAVGGADQVPHPRAGRGRGGSEIARGGRARGTDRGRGGFRGGRGGAAAANGTPRDVGALSVPTAESSAWDTSETAEIGKEAWDSTPAVTAEDEGQGSWGSVVASEQIPAAASEGAKSALIPEGGPKKSWASMFSQPKPKPAPAVPKDPVVPPPVPAELAAQGALPTQETAQEEPVNGAAIAEQPTIAEPASASLETPQQVLGQPLEPTEPAAAALPPPHDPLTEDNLEHLPDSSNPPATLTAASTVGSLDPRGVTPLGLGQQPPIGRPPMGGYASSAYRAAGMPGRSASFQRRVLEQQEAVVMPGHNSVDRAAVQFGSMGLNGDNEGLDVDEEREEPETRTQPPQHSPPSQPRASLPPAPMQAPTSQDSYLPESHSTPKQAPGLPPVPQHLPPGSQLDSASVSAQQSQSQDSYNQYGRYGQGGLQSEGAPAQKSYDPFSHQTPSSGFDHYSAQSQPSGQQHQQQQQQQGFGAYSSAPSSDYSQYYTADQRNAYQNYYANSYGQQGAQSQQDVGAAQQRTSSGLGAGSTDSSFPSSQGPQQTQSRYNDAQGSGNNTPNPLMGGQQQSSASSQQMPQQQQQHQGQGYGAGFPYGHPYYTSPYHAAYQNQFTYSGPSYGSPYGSKGGMYGQPHGYGMNQGSSYDQASSPANATGFNQQSSMPSRDSALSSGLGEYGRTSSTQGSQHNLGGGGFGSMGESFGRSQSGYQGQSQGYGQQGMPSSGQSDDLKPFGDSKAAGPSPSLGQPGRPGSAANSAGGNAQSGLPPPQTHQQGFGGYGSQYGSGLGGLGGHQGQSHQQGGYGGGYGGGFGQSNYNQYQRGGWGGNYPH